MRTSSCAHWKVAPILKCKEKLYPLRMSIFLKNPPLALFLALQKILVSFAPWKQFLCSVGDAFLKAHLNGAAPIRPSPNLVHTTPTPVLPLPDTECWTPIWDLKCCIRVLRFNWGFLQIIVSWYFCPKIFLTNPTHVKFRCFPDLVYERPRHYPPCRTRPKVLCNTYKQFPMGS